MKGEAKFLGGIASTKGVKGFQPKATKKGFFEIYLDSSRSKELLVRLASGDEVSLARWYLQGQRL